MLFLAQSSLSENKRGEGEGGGGGGGGRRALGEQELRSACSTSLSLNDKRFCVTYAVL